MEVDHIDSNRINNHALNLQWIDKSTHAIKTSGKRVVQRDLAGKLVAIHASSIDAAKAVEGNAAHLGRALAWREGRQSYRGYAWGRDDKDTAKMGIGPAD